MTFDDKAIKETNTLEDYINKLKEIDNFLLDNRINNLIKRNY